MKVSVKLDQDRVVYDKNGDVNMMVSLAAPDVSGESKRNPLCVCAVIDRSGSMRGAKLEHVKRSVWKMIDHMTEDDSLSLVFFDDAIETVPFRRMNSANKEAMKQEVAKVNDRGSTDIGSAVVAASKLFASYEGAAGSVERIMLLTDGQANIGAQSSGQFEPIIARIRGGVTVSTFGYGDGFNETLLEGISKQGRGNNYFIESPDNVAKVFAVELGGLLTCFAQDILVTVKAHKGASIVNVLNDLDVSTRQDKDGELITEIKVGDIYAGERRDVIVKLDFEKRPQALPRPITMADVAVSYRRMSDASNQSEESKAKVELVKTASEATKERDKEIAEQVAILEAAAVVAKAKEMADAGDWQGAQQLFRSSVTALNAVGTEKTASYAASMTGWADSLDADYKAGDTLSKGYSYASRAMRGRGLSAVGNVVSSTAAAPTMNCLMANLVDDFQKPDGVTPDVVAPGSPVVVTVTSTGNTTGDSSSSSMDKKAGYSKTRHSV